MGKSYLMCLDKEDREASDEYEDIVKFEFHLPLANHTSMMVLNERKKVKMAKDIATVLLKNPNVTKNIYIGNVSGDERQKLLRREVFKMSLVAVSEVGLADRGKKVNHLTNGKMEKYWCDLFTQNAPIDENYSLFRRIFSQMIADLQ